MYGPGHMTKMAVRPIYGKNPLKYILLQNHWADCPETWYVASGTLILHICINILYKWCILYCIVYINGDLGWTLTYLTAG